MEKVINVVTLEDGIEYGVIDEITLEDNKYVFLANINNESDVCFRKIIIRENQEYIVGLENEKEFELALAAFAKKHNNLLENL